MICQGGIDCMVIAALADQVVDPQQSIDLLNVAFENPRTNKSGDTFEFDSLTDT